MASLNFALIAAYAPAVLLNENQVEYMITGVVVLVITAIDWKLFIVHPYEVEAAVNDE